MAVNDPLAPKARRAPLSAEEAEQFASMIRPSWELIDPEELPPDLREPETAAGAMPASAPDTLVQSNPPAAVERQADAAEDAPIQPMPIKAIGINAEPRPDALPLPPPRGQPLKAPANAAPEPSRPVAPLRPFTPAKTRMGLGQDDEDLPVDSEALAPPQPAPAAAAASVPKTEAVPMRVAEPASAIRDPFPPPAAQQAQPAGALDQELPAQSVAALMGEAPAPPTSVAHKESQPASSSASRRAPDAPASDKPGATPPVYGDTDEIELPVAGAPKGLLLKIGVAAAAAIGLAVVGKVVLSPEGKPAPAPTAAVTASQAAVLPPPPPAETTAPVAAAPTPSAQPTVAPTPAVPTAQPTVAVAAPPKPEPQAAAPKPPPAATPKPEAPASPPPASPPKKPPSSPPPGPKPGGGIIRETPF